MGAYTQKSASSTGPSTAYRRDLPAEHCSETVENLGPVALRLLHKFQSRLLSPLAYRGARVIGTDTLRISVLLQVAGNDQERE